MTSQPLPAEGPASVGGGEGVGVEGRELAALVGGPWAGCWYWRDDLEAQQDAARAVHAGGGTAELGTKAYYQPTDGLVTSPDGECRGRGWTYQPPVIPRRGTASGQLGGRPGRGGCWSPGPARGPTPGRSWPR